jgi:hypothetical protein
MWQRRLDCLGISVAIECAVPAIEAQLAAVFRTYAESDRAPELRYRLFIEEWPTLERDDGERRRYDAPIDLVAALELDMYTQVAARASGLILHAAAVVGADGRALVFAGVSGAGKSTLLRSLLARGFFYLTEECVALSEAARCVGLARALHVAEEGVSVLDTFACERYEIRTAEGQRSLRIYHPPEDIIWRNVATAAAVVCLEHGPDRDDQLERLGSGATLARLWPMILRQRLAEAVDASMILSHVPCYSLRTTRPEHALEKALGLAKDLGVRSR